MFLLALLKRYKKHTHVVWKKYMHTANVCIYQTAGTHKNRAEDSEISHGFICSSGSGSSYIQYVEAVQSIDTMTYGTGQNNENRFPAIHLHNLIFMLNWPASASSPEKAADVFLCMYICSSVYVYYKCVCVLLAFWRTLYCIMHSSRISYLFGWANVLLWLFVYVYVMMQYKKC